MNEQKHIHAGDVLAEHERTGAKETVRDIGSSVFCDGCGMDYTESDATGGVMMARAASNRW